MPGGSPESYATLGPMLEKISAHVDGEPCCTHIGTDGSGHFVKMVHNGIEYADMQLIAEAYDLLRRGAGLDPARIAEVFADWNSGELDSYLIEITAEVLRQVDAATGSPLVDVILDAAGMKGTGTWTVQTALDLGIPVSGIAEAVFARGLSSLADQRAASRALPGPLPGAVALSMSTPSWRTSGRRCTRPRSWRTRRDSTRSPPVRRSMAGTSIVGRLPGSGVVAASFVRRSWPGSPRRMTARVLAVRMMVVRCWWLRWWWLRWWRFGCRHRWVPDGSSAPASLLLAPYFTEALGATQDSWRRVVAAAATSGVPTPGFATALAYYDGLRSERLPAALIQGQRDFFGAHTYRRVDRDGVFHTLWSGDRSEISAG